MSRAHSAKGGGARNARYIFSFKSPPHEPQREGEGKAPGARPRSLRASAGASGAGVGAEGPARKRTAGRQKHDLPMFYKAPVLGVEGVPRGVTQGGMWWGGMS